MMDGQVDRLTDGRRLCVCEGRYAFTSTSPVRNVLRKTSPDKLPALRETA